MRRVNTAPDGRKRFPLPDLSITLAAYFFRADRSRNEYKNEGCNGEL